MRQLYSVCQYSILYTNSCGVAAKQFPLQNRSYSTCIFLYSMDEIIDGSIPSIPVLATSSTLLHEVNGGVKFSVSRRGDVNTKAYSWNDEKVVQGGISYSMCLPTFSGPSIG